MPQPLRIQIASDLHVEFYAAKDDSIEDIILPQAPVLALLGDIGLACTDTLKSFLHLQADRFDKVLFLAGNHEYYNVKGAQKTVQEQTEWMQSVCSERDNLYFMEKDSMEIDGVVILATTLWSDIPEATRELANERMNDYNLCYKKHDDGEVRQLSAKDTVQWHHKSVQWLEQEIANAKERPVVVLTHHTPILTGTSAPQYVGAELNSCFSTNLTRLMQSPSVMAWSSGHTHYNYDFQVEDTRLFSNQKGYLFREAEGWNKKGAVLEIGSSSARILSN